MNLPLPIDEWLETNGLGGYASSTVTGMNTRRYHGLLVVDQSVLLSKVEEDLIINGERFYLSTNQYTGVLHPQGYQYINKFELKPFPLWTCSINGLEIQRSLFLVYGQNTLVLEYKIIKVPKDLLKAKIQLELRPLIAFRNYHNTTHQNNFLDPAVKQTQGQVLIKPYPDLPELFIGHNAKEIKTQGNWYKDFYYAREQERGLDFQEDLFNPCFFTYDFTKETPAGLIASLDLQNVADLEYFKKKESLRRSAFTSRLAYAADQFIVTHGNKKTVIAGYHWFGDWGRDTMIALPGLTLATGRFKDAEDILLNFSKYIDQGMLPNRFAEPDAPLEYNTVDAALWYFEAIRQYGEYTHKWDFIKQNFYDVLKSIIEWYIKGTRYNIRMDVDGLIFCGQEGVQLTWMDAKVGDWVVTPRYGKPVEIQALWFNALCFMEELARKFKVPEDISFYADLAQKVKLSFNQSFWNEGQKGLYDCLNGTNKDDRIRPNQILAISLGYAVLDGSKFKDVLELVDRELLTPYGLRTLNRSHPDYIGIYQGGPGQRDSAYHQGTVWPWLLGPYIRAVLRTYGDNASTKKRIKQVLKPIQSCLDTYGLGQIGEIFDGDAPHAPKGCIAQAWSVGQVLENLT